MNGLDRFFFNATFILSQKKELFHSCPYNVLIHEIVIYFIVYYGTIKRRLILNESDTY
ncbi:hypothetical protein KR50_15610 [Jeotgalibacillus campisalis]|uniref:Uncharacterized protein n=1 Tax=Jeotgalibacillus campisalis TaxID=220754 RepID=A0A0C2RZZ4_9BACL|nr:hypothetical protein KR50_15610 [Jeotgalibacillus campisalis]